MIEEMTRDVVAEQFAKLGGSLEGTAEPAGDAGDTDIAEPASEPERASPGTARDEKGRFSAKAAEAPGEAAKAADPGTPVAQGAAAVAVAPATAAAPELKPPQDWRAEARAEFAKLPRVVQEEALRLHVETKKGLQDLAEARKEAGSWKEATGPYGHVFGGQPPQQVVGNLLRTFAALQSGHPQQRAAVIADIVRSYIGTDEQAIRILASALDGQPVAPGPSAQPALSHDQIRQLARQEWETAQRGAQSDAAVKTWKDFETANGEFLNEPGFRQRIAIELQVAMDSKGGQPTREDIQSAYDAACQTHPGVAKIMNQRKEAEAVGKANASTQTRTAAAIGIKNEPAVVGSMNEPAKDVREEVTRQYARLSNKRR